MTELFVTEQLRKYNFIREILLNQEIIIYGILVKSLKTNTCICF